MSLGLCLRVGDVVPIALQIADGATDQYPQVEIYDESGIHLTTITLNHVANGMYRPASMYSMPDKSYIQAVYIVYSDSGHTTESATYTRDIDTFYKIDVDDYKADVSVLAIEANVEGHVTNALNAYDPPTKTELDIAESNIRGSDGDDLKTISDQIDALDIESGATHDDLLTFILGLY